MWIFMNDSFLSIVEDRDRPGFLRVRARVAGDIERVFPFCEGEVEERPRNDYRFMALVPRAAVAEAITRRIVGIDYGNFKDSVPESDRHDYYAEVWGAMYRFAQERLQGALGRYRSMQDRIRRQERAEGRYRQ